MYGTGTDQSKTGVLSVKDYGTGYEAGKIVLSDKSRGEKMPVHSTQAIRRSVFCAVLYTEYRR